MLCRNERIWLAGAIGIILALSAVPYMAGYRAETQDWIFSGAGFAVLAAPDIVLSHGLFGVQRQFLFTITISLAVLGSYGVEQILLPWLGQHLDALYRRRRMVGQVYNALAAVSTLYLVFGMALFHLPTHPPELFDSTASVRILDWLKINAGPADVVLSTEATGRIVAEKTGLTVYLGHPIETLNYEEKTMRVDRFSSGAQPEGWISEQDVQWVYWRSPES